MNKTKHMKHLFLFGLLAVLLSACGKDDDSIDYGPIDEQLIKKYLTDNHLEAQRHASGLYYNIIKPGRGNKVFANARVTIRYTGRLLAGTIFENDKKLSDYPLHNLIPAWQIGVPMLRIGSEAVFYCPSGLAYGNEAKGGIPANSVLIFDIKVVNFK